jgi:hypothetical protein
MKYAMLSLACLAIAMGSQGARAQDAEADPRDKLEISPVILEAQDGQGSTIGLDFSLRGKKVLRQFDSNPPETGTLEGAEDVVLGDVRLTFDLSGTATADEERNPKDFLNAALDLQFSRSAPKWGGASGGAFFKYETDQSFDNEQSVYGLRVTYGKRHALRRNDFIALDLNRGQVDPATDKARGTVLGTTNLEKYYRTQAELLYMFPLKEVIPILGNAVEGFEFNYRYFRESDAPAALKAAGLNSFFLRTFRLKLAKQLFVAYSNGKLPFDLKDDDFFELGLSYKLE